MRLLAAALAAVTFSAQALTIESGEVLVTDEDGNQSVVHVSETEAGQQQLEEDGYVVVGNNVVIDIEGVGPVTVTIEEAIAGGDILRDAIIEEVRGEITDLSELEGLSSDEIEQALQDNDIGEGISVEEIQELIDETQFEEFGDQYGDEVEQALRDLDDGTITGATIVDDNGNTHVIGDGG